MSNVPERFSLLGILRGLMLSDHFGDVRDEVNHLHDLLGIPRPEGGYAEGWTAQDLEQVGAHPDQEDRS
ncbi:MAG TPA: hypothetical protein VEW07_13355 [Solirubrobacterales bacterium]|nr:hypothetical protein [Solirubrobacterales bacterium]